MAEEASSQHLDRSAQLLAAERWQEALSEADKALELDPSSVDGLLMRGMALSKLGAAETANEAFRRAIMIAPYNAKAYYNLAVHYNANAQQVAAIEMLREALRIDPHYEDARKLGAHIESEQAQQQAAAPTEPQPIEPPVVVPGAPQPPYGGYNPSAPTGWGYSAPRAGTIPALNSLGKVWTGIAWFLAAASFPPYVIFLVSLFPIALRAQGDQQKAMAALEAEAYSNPVLMASLLALLGVGLLALLWMLIDLIHRQGPWSWLIGMALMSVGGIVCCGSFGLPFILLPLYLLLRRN